MGLTSAGLLLLAPSIAGAQPQSSDEAWTSVPDRLVVVAADGSTSRCGWFVTLDDRLIALRSVAGTPVPDRRDHALDTVRAVTETHPNHQPLPMPGLLLMADGQRLPGEPRISEGRVLWRNRWTGEVEVDLERIAAIRFAPDGEIPESRDSDMVELLNGDRLPGLIGSIGPDVTIEDARSRSVTNATTREAEAVSIPLERIRSIRLLPAPVEAEGPRAWFADGTVAAGRIVADEESGGMRFIPALPPTSRSGERSRESIRVRPEDLRAYLPDVRAVLPLASIPTAEVNGTGTWPAYAPPEVVVAKTPGPADAPDIVIHGPSTVRWSLPKGPWILVAQAMIDAPDAAWTSFDLVVRDGSREVFRKSFDADTKATALAVPLAGDSLSIDVTEGERGPIADAVRLRRAMLLRP